MSEKYRGWILIFRGCKSCSENMQKRLEAVIKLWRCCLQKGRTNRPITCFFFFLIINNILCLAIVNCNKWETGKLIGNWNTLVLIRLALWYPFADLIYFGMQTFALIWAPYSFSVRVCNEFLRELPWYWDGGWRRTLWLNFQTIKAFDAIPHAFY